MYEAHMQLAIASYAKHADKSGELLIIYWIIISYIAVYKVIAI